jgi:hypothetical protein
MDGESIELTIPALDGQREVYVTTLLTTYPDNEEIICSLSEDPNNEETIVEEQHVNDVERLGNGWGGASYWDADCLGEVVYVGKNFNNALETYKDLISQQKITSQQTVQDALHQANKLKHIVGVFKVISICQSGITDLVFGVEVDVDAYNTAKHAADDLKDF